jgi:hypothetical protein
MAEPPMPGWLHRVPRGSHGIATRHPPSPLRCAVTAYSWHFPYSSHVGRYQSVRTCWHRSFHPAPKHVLGLLPFVVVAIAPPVFPWGGLLRMTPIQVHTFRKARRHDFHWSFPNQLQSWLSLEAWKERPTNAHQSFPKRFPVCALTDDQRVIP